MLLKGAKYAVHQSEEPNTLFSSSPIHNPGIVYTLMFVGFLEILYPFPASLAHNWVWAWGSLLESRFSSFSSSSPSFFICPYFTAQSNRTGWPFRFLWTHCADLRWSLSFLWKHVFFSFFFTPCFVHLGVEGLMLAPLTYTACLSVFVSDRRKQMPAILQREHGCERRYYAALLSISRPSVSVPRSVSERTKIWIISKSSTVAGVANVFVRAQIFILTKHLSLSNSY